MRLPDKSLALEPLESRRLLATLISSQIVRFQDLDGDTVLVSLSRPVLTAENVDSVFRFTTGGVSGDDSTRQGLLDIRLSEVLSGARGVNLRALVSARAAGGSSDGVATVGQISAEGIDLGIVRIDGSLGRIRSGDANLLTPGLRSLSTISLGTGTVPVGADYRSVIQGRVDAIRSVDLRGSIDVQGGAAGQIGSLELAGSIVGGAEDGSGRVTASGPIGTVSIDSLLGGAGDRSGRIEASRFLDIRIRSARRGVLGGEGDESGSIAATGPIGTIAITGYVVGGSGPDSGTVSAASINRFSAVSIDGGGATGGDRAGAVVARGTINFAKAAVIGGAGASSGVLSAARLPRVEGGMVQGGAGMNSGAIATSGSIGRATITTAIRGGSGSGSGVVRAEGAITQLDVGRIAGGGGEGSGSVFAAVNVNYVSVRGVVQGGDGRLSGTIGSSGRVGFVFCDRIAGGNGEMSGTVYAQRVPGMYSPPTNPPYQSIDWVRARNGIVGAGGASSGSIVADHFIRTVEVTSGRHGLVGGSGRDSGTVRSGDWSGQVPPLAEDLGGIFSIKIPRIVGGVGLRSGSVLATSLLRGDAPYQIIGGAGDESGSIVAHNVALPGTAGGMRASRPGITDIRGGSGYASGSVRGVYGTLGIRDLIGGEGERSGSLEFSDSATVYAYDIWGGSGSYTGRVSAPNLIVTAANILGGSATGEADLVESGAVVAETLVIRLRAPTDVPSAGELRAGSDTTSGVFARNGAIIAGTINGSIGRITGNETNPAIVAAVEEIGSLSVMQTVARGLIVAGRGFGVLNPRTGMLFGTNPDARIGTVRIGGSLVASSIAAGVRTVDGHYGNTDDVKVDATESYPDDPAVYSRIDQVQIRGEVFGTSVAGDSFGLVAEQLGSVSVRWTGGVWQNVYPGSTTASRRGLADGSTGDVFLVSLDLGLG